MGDVEPVTPWDPSYVDVGRDSLENTLLLLDWPRGTFRRWYDCITGRGLMHGDDLVVMLTNADIAGHRADRLLHAACAEGVIVPLKASTSQRQRLLLTPATLSAFAYVSRSRGSRRMGAKQAVVGIDDPTQIPPRYYTYGIGPVTPEWPHYCGLARATGMRCDLGFVAAMVSLARRNEEIAADLLTRPVMSSREVVAAHARGESRAIDAVALRSLSRDFESRIDSAWSYAVTALVRWMYA